MSYQPRQLPDLSPATNNTARRIGSNAKRMRTSLDPAEPGRSSFMFWCIEDLIRSTKGLPKAGTIHSQLVDRVLYQVRSIRVVLGEVVEPVGDLLHEQDLPSRLGYPTSLTCALRLTPGQATPVDRYAPRGLHKGADNGQSAITMVFAFCIVRPTAGLREHAACGFFE